MAKKEGLPIYSTLIPTIIDKLLLENVLMISILDSLKTEWFFSEKLSILWLQILSLLSFFFSKNKMQKHLFTMHINSPGGHVTAGPAIYDTMQYIKPDVITVAVGMAASMGSVIPRVVQKVKLCSPTQRSWSISLSVVRKVKQQRSKLAAEHILKTGSILYKILAKHTGQPIEQIEKTVIVIISWMPSRHSNTASLIKSSITRHNLFFIFILYEKIYCWTGIYCHFHLHHSNSDSHRSAVLVPMTVGICLAVLIYMGASVSGAHYNPAVTLALWLRKKIVFKQAFDT